MNSAKQEAVKEKLHQIAMADGIIVEKEKNFIINLDR